MDPRTGKKAKKDKPKEAPKSSAVKREERAIPKRSNLIELHSG